MQRRSLLNTSATMAVGAVAGCALPGTAAQDVKTPFTVPATYVPIVGSELMFPVRRIYCIGRNYRAHAIEMGSNPDPSLIKNYHHEVELVAALNKGGRNIPQATALEYV